MANTFIVSEATLRPEDLVPKFIATLDSLIEEATMAPGADAPHKVERIGKVQAWLGNLESRLYCPAYYAEQSEWDLEVLFDLLDEFAPEGTYFGAAEGDGACFGFWALED